MTTYLPDLFFQSRGLHTRPAAPALGCPTDELLAGFASELLPARDRQALVRHVLDCVDCHDVVRALADLDILVAPALRPVSVSVPVRRLVARIASRGLELLELVDEAVGAALAAPALQLRVAPALALGGLRGAGPTAEPVTLAGPGQGLDAIELQAHADDTARVIVHGSRPDDLRPDDRLSVVLEVDGSLRERRPFLGQPVAFAPVGPGRHRVRLMVRARGGAARELSRADIELRG
jgi:hypothetical protein